MHSVFRFLHSSFGAVLLAAVVALSTPPTAVGSEESAAENTPRLHELARPRVAIPGAPKAADVCMRSLRPRPINDRDPRNTLDAMRGFHVTWLEWTYGNNAAFIGKVHELGATYGAAAAAGSYLGDVPVEQWNVVDLDGNRLVATWMRQWPRPNPWGCANHPEFRAGHVRAVIAAIEAGADVLQRDEPAQNQTALRWGGCFCDHCMAAFPEWLRRHADPAVLKRLGAADLDEFNYRDYLRAKNAPVGDAFHRWAGDELKQYFQQFQFDSTVAFNAWWREQLDRHAGRRVPVSCNNGVRSWTEIQLGFDYCIGELSAAHARPDYLYAAMRQAASFGKRQSVTMPLRRDPEETPDWIRHTRQTIATVYAVGGHIEMPWDTYLPTPDARRYFGNPADYADLTAFVRGMAVYLESYEDSFALGKDIDDDRYAPEAAPVVLKAETDQVFAFVRAKPGQAGAPVVIHLLDWREQPQPLSVTVEPRAFFGTLPLRFRLFTPVLPHDQAAHDRAFNSKDYSELVRETELARSIVNTVDLPALRPWGMLIVEPDAAIPVDAQVPETKLPPR
ncbi:MAG: hypothetical protein RBS80_24300 [Thermoguttaceae bacterium]|jgi:hypothetical protein|nr:hypothetical protein [Thermoguttaceae bacterium]